MKENWGLLWWILVEVLSRWPHLTSLTLTRVVCSHRTHEETGVDVNGSKMVHVLLGSVQTFTNLVALN